MSNFAFLAAEFPAVHEAAVSPTVAFVPGGKKWPRFKPFA
jgi:hypothetical protein